MQEAALINTGIKLGIVHNTALIDPPINIRGLQIFHRAFPGPAQRTCGTARGFLVVPFLA
jgi:hypothetical protein